MPKVVVIYIMIQIVAVIFGILTLIFWDKRYRKNHGTKIPAGFERTEEVSIDPKTNKKLRVYYNTTTGGRFYHEEE